MLYHTETCRSNSAAFPTKKTKNISQFFKLMT